MTRRRDRLADHLKLGRELTEADLLARCAEWNGKLNAGDIVPVQKQDVVALELLIRSRQDFPGYVATWSLQRETKPADYAQRGEYLNHPWDDNSKAMVAKTSKNRLLWEVMIDFPNEILPPNLEMVDLPGLGATSYHDTCVTLDIIDNKGEEGLDGALLFLRCDQLSDGNVIDIIRSLQQCWGGRFNGRVWAIFTKYDGLTNPHFNNTPNFFIGVDELLTASNIPKNCAFIISNEINKVHKPEMTDEKKVEVSGIKLSRELTDDSLTKNFERFPYFQPLIHAVYLNGGLDHLRESIQERLGTLIGQELAEDVRKNINRIESEIARTITLAQRRKKQSNEDLKHATQCAKKVNSLILQVRKGLPEFKTATYSIRDGMRTAVTNYATVDDLDHLPTQDVQNNFLTLANRLDHELGQRIVNEGVQPIYRRVAQDLKDLPELSLTNAESIQVAWEASIDHDSEIENWNGDLPRFDYPDLIKQICGASDPIQGPGLKALLDDKIQAVTLVTMFRIRERVMNHLTAISGQLNLLVTGQ